jgi:DNA-binding GntR family transcriptional regulator
MPRPLRTSELTTPEAEYRTKAEWAYLQLRRWIQSGELEPGDRLDQEVLARRLKISRVPLRQALVKLRADGLVVGRPHAGATVAPLSLADAEDIYAARAALEPMLTEAAVVCCTDGTVCELEELISLQRKALDQGDRRGFLELDRKFHERLYGEAGYPTSLDLVQRLRDLSDRYVAAYKGDALRSHATLVEHREIVRLCGMRDAAGAAHVMRAHVRQGIEYLRQRSETLDSSIAQ